MLNKLLGFKGEKMTEWICVKDKLPEKDGEYLVYDGELMWTSLYKWPTDKGNALGFGTLFIPTAPFVSKRITHWMPLPNPPEEI